MKEIHGNFTSCLVLSWSIELQIMNIKEELQVKVKERVDKHQREYILREQLKLIREELGDDTTMSDAEEFEAATKKLEASKEVKEKLMKEIKRFKNSMGSAAETSVIRTYIETMLEMPWDKKKEESYDLATQKRFWKKNIMDWRKSKSVCWNILQSVHSHRKRTHRFCVW